MRWLFFKSPNAAVYDYDPADDGPECEVITRILASQPLYVAGKEAELLRFQLFVDKIARQLYGKRYGLLGQKRKQRVMRKVVALHLTDERGYKWNQ